jgi:hypothetical protein
LACAALAGAARAEEPDPRLFERAEPDGSPTANACSIETLLADRPCTFESLAAKAAKPGAQARENAKRAALMADEACGRAARPRDLPRADPGILAACKRDFLAAAEVCGGDGEYELLDAENRFSRSAKPCYRQMVGVLSQARVMAASTGGCCRCLAKTTCARPAEQCNRDLARGAAAITEKCLNVCADACRTFVPDKGPPPGSFEPWKAPATSASDSTQHIHTPGVKPRTEEDDDHVYNPPAQVIVR